MSENPKYVKNRYSTGGFDIASSSLVRDHIAIMPRGVGPLMQHLDPAELAEALNDIIPGFRARYLAPIQVPQGKYAVVENNDASATYLRLDHDMWRPSYYSARTHYDSDIESILRAGGRVVFEGETNV